jgi:hypothetical protein
MPSFTGVHHPARCPPSECIVNVPALFVKPSPSLSSGSLRFRYSVPPASNTRLFLASAWVPQRPMRDPGRPVSGRAPQLPEIIGATRFSVGAGSCSGIFPK